MKRKKNEGNDAIVFSSVIIVIKNKAGHISRILQNLEQEQKDMNINVLDTFIGIWIQSIGKFDKKVNIFCSDNITRLS